MRIRSLRTLALLGVAAGLLAVAPTSANAGVDAREARQRERIHDGIADGSLTRGEARRLGREQVRIERMEQRFRANDGRLGPRERHRLQHRLDHSSKQIFRARHNRRTR